MHNFLPRASGKGKKLDNDPLFTRVGISTYNEKWHGHDFDTQQQHFRIFKIACVMRSLPFHHGSGF